MNPKLELALLLGYSKFNRQNSFLFEECLDVDIGSTKWCILSQKKNNAEMEHSNLYILIYLECKWEL